MGCNYYGLIAISIFKEQEKRKIYIIDRMKKIKITQVRSAINRPARQKRSLQALGLKKMHRSVEHNATPQILGIVDSIKHLIQVEEI